MFRFVRGSLLVQLLGGYLLFIGVVLATGVGANVVVQRQLRAEIHASDLALAQEIALETDSKLGNARESLAALARLDDVRRGTAPAMVHDFEAFKAARADVDRVYWLDTSGIMRVSVPMDVRTVGADFSRQRLFQRAVSATEPIVEPGIVDLTTFNAVVGVAAPVRDDGGRLVGVVATNLLLDDLSAPLRQVIDAQAQRHQRLTISVIDDQGQLIATPERERLLQPVVGEMPGAAEALAGQTATRQAPGPRDQQWLFSAVPVPGVGWAVVVQRPTADALAVVRNFTNWLTAAALLFGFGGLLFWLVLMARVIRPLHGLTRQYGALSPGRTPSVEARPSLAGRTDEVGNLAHALRGLQRDVMTQLAELRTLLETSNAVVGTLDPHAVVGTIIQAVRRLVDVQAVAVLVPDEAGVLRVLASEGRSDDYQSAVQLSPEDLTMPSVRALREGRPVQIIAGPEMPFPPLSYAEGFRALLAIPIVSQHVGGVVLTVYRTQPEPFTTDEIDLLVTFANHATLAWEHAVLYERSDERLREIAQENERLYRRAMEEKQTLAAIMASMNDGLILTDITGAVLYANRGAGAIVGLPVAAIEKNQIAAIHATLRGVAVRPEEYDRGLARAGSDQQTMWVIEIERDHARQAIGLRVFNVQDESGHAIGRGLLLRDVTREREIDQFKTTLLAAVGHELRTPLAAIKGHTSTLLQDDVTWSSNDQRHFLQTISDETDRLTQLVRNLLDLSRIEAGLLHLERTTWQLDDLIASAVRGLHHLGRPVSVRLPEGLPPVSADGARIEVVVRNLLSNALAYGEGDVRITAARRGDTIVVRVSDNGPGFSPDELPHLFERFYRAQYGLQRRSGGTGLGLAICKAFVEAHGGAIWAESGEAGTTVSFSLPIEPVAVEGDRAEELTATGGNTTRRGSGRWRGSRGAS